MSTLNEELLFDTLSFQVRDSFWGMQARRTLFPAGTQLVRVVTITQNSFGGSFCILPAFYDQLQAYAGFHRIPLRNLIREKLAVLSRFSASPDVAVRITLGKNAYGFMGNASAQSDVATNEGFNGGGVQIFIPNLTKEHSNRFSLYGTL